MLLRPHTRRTQPPPAAASAQSSSASPSIARPASGDSAMDHSLFKLIQINSLASQLLRLKFYARFSFYNKSIWHSANPLPSSGGWKVGVGTAAGAVAPTDCSSSHNVSAQPSHNDRGPREAQFNLSESWAQIRNKTKKSYWNTIKIREDIEVHLKLLKFNILNSVFLHLDLREIEFELSFNWALSLTGFRLGKRTKDVDRSDF